MNAGLKRGRCTGSGRFGWTLAWRGWLASFRAALPKVGERPVKARLLLVEDSITQGNQTKAELERLGYDVRWVKSGIEALKWARQDPPDLIVLDVVMDDIDGFAVCRWLKLHAGTRDIPIIMLTVRGEIDDRVQGLQVGADDYLPKPFSERELEARIFATLRTKTSQVELVERNQHPGNYRPINRVVQSPALRRRPSPRGRRNSTLQKLIGFADD